MDRFEIVVGDITHSDAEAIVNAANTTLLGGSGVDGAIHRAAGPELYKVCRGLSGCETGKAKLTPGFRLKAWYVIHTPGPVWQGGGFGEPVLLGSCYRSCLEVAASHQIHTLDFPSISTGIYGYPLPQASAIAVQTILEYLAEHPLPYKVRMVCHSEAAAAVYRQTLELYLSKQAVQS